MDEGSYRVLAFRRELIQRNLSNVWSRYYHVHNWPGRWDEVTEEQLAAAEAWMNRVTENSFLLELQKCLNLPEEEGR